MKELVKQLLKCAKVDPKSTSTKVGAGVIGGLLVASQGAMPELDIQTTVGCITSLLFGLWSFFTKD